MLKISTFNVNSIRARMPRLLAWLKESNPDIVCLQELKCEEKNFPFEELLDAGYNSAVNGQKTYNGVAILSKYKIEDISKTLPMLDPNQEQDSQARYIEAVIALKNQAIRVSSIYVPNGGGELSEGEELKNSPKFLYKLDFFDRLKNHFQKILSYNEIQIFGGDFNVAIDDLDIFDSQLCKDQLLFHPLERSKIRSLKNLGLIDSYRICNPHDKEFSWWDYRGNSYQKNKGARIDYLFLSPLGADNLLKSYLENYGVRDQEKASDHCPATIEIKN